MKTHITQFLLAVIMFLTVCLLTIIVIKPFSVLIFIGSAAGITSAIILLWGTHLLAAIVTGSLLLNLILYYYFSAAFSLSIFMISTLAICLQGFWVKRLTYKVISTQRWLNSRRKLVYFILKIGPLSSLVSAVTSVLIAVIYIQEFDGNLFYAFFRTWAASTLISVFIIPTLLFFQGKQQLNSGKKVFVIISSVLGGVSIALLFKIFQDQHQHYRVDDFYGARDFVKSELRGEISKIERQLNAIKAYFETSDSISQDKFSEFSAYIMGDYSSLEAIEWVPIVQHADRRIFEKYVSGLLDFDYQINLETLSGDKVAHPKANIYLPIQYVFPRYQNEEVLGTNVFSDLNKKRAIDKAIQTGKASSTMPISFIVSGFDDPVINVVLPVYSQYLVPSFGKFKTEDNQVITGVIIGVVKISTLFSRVTKFSEENNVNVYVTGIDSQSPYVIYGQKSEHLNRLVDTDIAMTFLHQWQYTISEKNPWVIQTKKWQTWAMLIGGTFGGLIFQILILMMAAYSSELSFRVSKQTRELILSKEKSDNENQAKTQFLHALSIELRIPLSVISTLIEVFPTKKLDTQEKEYINNISNAALNLEQLIDTLNELSTIESGNLELNKQSFDFRLFLNRLEDITEVQVKNIQFIVQNDVPQFIKTDELRLQQICMSCVESACELFDNSDLSVSVKVHFHKKSNATIVFVITPVMNNHDENNFDRNEIVNDEINHFNLKMAMAKELANRLGGNVTLAKLPSGQPVINVSIKVLVSQDRNYEFDRFNQLSMNDTKNPLMLKQILFIEGKVAGNMNFCRQLSALNYHLVVKRLDEVITTGIDSHQYALVVYDCYDMQNNLDDIVLLKDKTLLNTPTLGLFNHPPSNSKLTLVNNKFTFYLLLPISTENLSNLLSKYIAS